VLIIIIGGSIGDNYMHFIEEKAMTLTLFDGSMAREIEPFYW
jgi:hypothetical protein